MVKLNYPVPAGIVAGTIAAATRNREKELKQLAKIYGFKQIYYGHQVHSGTILRYGKDAAGTDGDAAFCDKKGVLLGVFTADCVPVLVFGEGIVGVIHAGWRGFRENIFAHFFSSIPVPLGKLQLIIGPAICGNCYEIGEETAVFFHPPELRVKAEKHFALDLPELTVSTLISLGALPKNIRMAGECTRCGKMGFHSYRKTGTPLRNISFIGQTTPNPPIPK